MNQRPARMGLGEPVGRACCLQSPLKAPPLRCVQYTPAGKETETIAAETIAAVGVAASHLRPSGSKRDAIILRRVRRGLRGLLGRGGAKGEREIFLTGLRGFHPSGDLELLAVDLSVAAIIWLTIALLFVVIPEQGAAAGVIGSV